ncbi:MAG: hypothetical protein PHD76_01695 [Methylacidiphilales bacterium]|nr:hypothetical protein [Candidatus Methylacidiphilales bacterium]
MKLSKFFAAGFLALSFSGAVHAATVVHITGSTAFRKSTIVAIEKLMIAGPGGGTYSDGTTTISANKFKAAYNATTAANGEQGDTYVVLEGTITGASNPVIVKATWSGSVGGLITVADQIDTTQIVSNGYLSTANLDSVSESNTVGNANIIGGKSDFTTTRDGDNEKAQIAMSDSFAASAGISSGLTASATGGGTPGLVGIVPFEWVANNGVTAPVKFTGCSSATASSTITYTSAIYTPTGALASNAQISAVNVLGGPSIARNVGITGATGTGTLGGTITIASANTSTLSAISSATYVGAVNGSNPITSINQLQALGLLTTGGAFLSQFTGNSADAVAVYAMGRNFDSGTRLSELAETTVGVFGSVNAQHQPSFVGGTTYSGQVFPNRGKGGGADKYMATLDQWAAEDIYPSPFTKSFGLGQSGFNGGGDLADALATPGSLGAPDSGVGAAPALNGSLAQNGGWLIGYLGRSDATRACKATTGANTAHHIPWNGQQDWTGSEAADGSVTFNNAAITEGLYSLWEYEFLYYANGASAAQKTVGDKIAAQIFSTDASAAGILFGSMNVSKSIEGGVITHN